MRSNPERIVIRTTAQRKKAIKDKAKEVNMTVSDYMLTMEEEGIIYVLEEAKKPYRQIAGMANNLNQITHLCHMGKIKDPEILNQLQELMKGVNQLLLLLSSLIQKIKGTKYQSRPKAH